MDTDKMNRWLTLGANVGVLIGLILLLFEIRQNSDLMRAQITMDRTTLAVQNLSNWANGGEIAVLNSRLAEDIDGFPKALGWLDQLTAEEKQRYYWWVLGRSIEQSNDWFQCSQGFVDQDVCRREVRERMRIYLHRFYELGISGSGRDSYIKVMQELAIEEGLPAVNNDGVWQ